SKGQILDDEIYENLVTPLPKGCRLTAIFDSCHSGTVMDLPYTYQCDGSIEVIENDVPIIEKKHDADVIQFSGCRDNQTSADAKINNQATGAMSYAFITVLNENPNLTYSQLLTQLDKLREKNFKQIPQLSTSHPMNMNEEFIM
ncbi:peptidase C14, partial [Piromyces finnis]